jgi:hypothetical protein
MPVEGLPERFEVDVGERIDEDDLSRNGYLEKAELLRIRMQAIRFCIDGRPRGVVHPAGQIT